ncbi:SLC3A2 family protein [Megaselia abdita]
MDDKLESHSFAVSVKADTSSEKPNENYKPIKEDQGQQKEELKEISGEDKNTDKENSSSEKKPENGKMVQEGDITQDGADERMLNNENDDVEKLTVKKEEIKFIPADQKNGDAKIDIGEVDKKEADVATVAFVGMSKDELMKYANDPFWVRLRWIFFILFWAAWAAMLIGAVMIIVNAPKCAPPQPLPWYKKGPLVKFSSELQPNDAEVAQKLHSSAVIYELNPVDTYNAKSPEVQNRIRDLVLKYKNSSIDVILDITPNYAPGSSDFVKNALEDKEKRSGLVLFDVQGSDPPTTWLSIVNGSAWSKINEKYWALSQFGENLYDLNMNSTYVKDELNSILNHLIHLGVKGFRFRNTKHFIVKLEKENLVAEEISQQTIVDNMNDYRFWNHKQTTFQEGLGDLLQEYKLTIKNATDFEGFLGVTDDILRPEAYKTKDGNYGIDLPIYGRIGSDFDVSQKDLYGELKRTLETTGNTTWLQWNYHSLPNQTEPTAFSVFFMLLPGVPVVTAPKLENVNEEYYKEMAHLRSSPSFMHGSFDLYNSTQKVVAYSRIKSGNPGYFVAINPTNEDIVADFSGNNLPDKMTVDFISANFNTTAAALKSKIDTNAIPLTASSAVILTYVPKN